ncbi:MAG: metal ABC transporter solute-binding protein, Zn/Mn family [Planctomycetota bacterium]
MRRVALAAVLAGVTGAGCSGEDADAPAAPVAATNTYLACCAREFLGADAPVVELSGGAMCPGHFAIRPGQVRDLRRCRVLLRFGFQEDLDAKLQPVSENMRIVGVNIPGGLCEPESYLAACRAAADALVECGLVDRDRAEQTLGDIARRMGTLDAEARRRIRQASLQAAAVLASEHQASFCRRLGLEVAATFPAVDRARPRQLDRARRAGRDAGAKLVVANRPEGRRVADKLADDLDVPTVVLDNFPRAGLTFDEMVRANLAALVAACD